MLRTKVGTVQSAKMQNTAVVAISRTYTHPLYGKKLTRTTRLKADTREVEVKEGDEVEIVEAAPISKTKCWKVTKVLS